MTSGLHWLVMRASILAAACALSTAPLWAQGSAQASDECSEKGLALREVATSPSEVDTSRIYALNEVDVLPQFPGGDTARVRWIDHHLRYYPECGDITGKVYVEFVVRRDGRINTIVVKRGVHPTLDKEAVRVLKDMPSWKPASLLGVPVHVRMVLPVSFKIQ